MNVFKSNSLLELSKATTGIQKSYFVALLILATIAIGNYFVISNVMKAQVSVSELLAQVTEGEFQYRRIKGLLQLTLSDLANKRKAPLHKSIQSELKDLEKKLKQNRIKIERIIATPRSQLSIGMGFPEIVTELITLLPSHSKAIEAQLEHLVL